VLQEKLQQANKKCAELLKALEQQQKIVQKQKDELENAHKLLEEKTREFEQLQKYKSEFLANMSHELRTPLNSVLVFSKILCQNKGGNLTPKQAEFASTIHTAGANLLKLINEVLDFSALEMKEAITLHVEDMSLSGLSTYIKHTFRPIAEQKGLELKLKLSENILAHIYTDRQRVEQIVKNILTNALKFTKEGEIGVYIDRPPAGIELSHSGLDPQCAIAIAIADTGIGIPKNKQEVIFEAFRQADGETTRKYEGAGLGLSVARSLAKLLGGEIQVESEEGKGSTFTLYLPEVITTEDQKSPHVTSPQPQALLDVYSASSAEETALLDLKQLEISAIRDDRHDIAPADKVLLIIENDPKPAKILFDQAHERGFKCLIGGDGEAGLQLADQYMPSAIILNIGLPGIDGWMVMERLKDNLVTRHIPVCFSSSQEKALDALKMGAIGYLKKPITNDSLESTFNTIEKILAKALRKLLVVQDDETMRRNMLELLRGDDISIATAATVPEAYNRLNSDEFDCMVLDLRTTDILLSEFLETLEQEKKHSCLPVIVYCEREFTQEEELGLKKYEEGLVLKRVTAQEQLLDEVTLFLHRAEADLPEAHQKKLRMIHDKEAVLSGKTVLMADADMRNVFALSSILEEKGMNVLIGENAKEAFKLLDNNPGIDLILLDTMLPGMDGYEVMKQIRNRRAFRKYPIIALSAKAKRGDRQKCMKAGASDYLSKPIDTDKLLSLLRIWLY